jgi:hypothetical protein
MTGDKRLTPDPTARFDFDVEISILGRWALGMLPFFDCHDLFGRSDFAAIAPA